MENEDIIKKFMEGKFPEINEVFRKANKEAEESGAKMMKELEEKGTIVYNVPDQIQGFFSKRDLGGVNPDVFEMELKYLNTKERLHILEAKILGFFKDLQLAAMVESRTGLEAEYWRDKFEKDFNIQKFPADE